MSSLFLALINLFLLPAILTVLCEPYKIKCEPKLIQGMIQYFIKIVQLLICTTIIAWVINFLFITSIWLGSVSYTMIASIISIIMPKLENNIKLSLIKSDNEKEVKDNEIKN